MPESPQTQPEEDNPETKRKKPSGQGSKGLEEGTSLDSGSVAHSKEYETNTENLSDQEDTIADGLHTEGMAEETQNVAGGAIPKTPEPPSESQTRDSAEQSEPEAEKNPVDEFVDEVFTKMADVGIDSVQLQAGDPIVLSDKDYKVNDSQTIKKATKAGRTQMIADTDWRIREVKPHEVVVENSKGDQKTVSKKDIAVKTENLPEDTKKNNLTDADGEVIAQAMKSPNEENGELSQEHTKTNRENLEKSQTERLSAVFLAPILANIREQNPELADKITTNIQTGEITREELRKHGIAETLRNHT